MKKIIAGLLALLFCASLHAQTTIKLSNGEWAPWLSEHLKYNGVVSRIVTEAFNQEGIQVEYVFVPWKRAFSLAVEGGTVGSAVWTKTPDREKILYYSDPVVTSQTVFFYRKTDPIEWKELTDLQGKKIGITSGYNYGDEFAAAIKAKLFPIDEGISDEVAFKMLLNKRTDAFISDKDVGLDALQRFFSKEARDQITYHPKNVTTVDLFLVLSKKDPENEQLIKTFNQGLKKLKSLGKVMQYLEESRRGDYNQK